MFVEELMYVKIGNKKFCLVEEKEKDMIESQTLKVNEILEVPKSKKWMGVFECQVSPIVYRAASSEMLSKWWKIRSVRSEKKLRSIELNGRQRQRKRNDKKKLQRHSKLKSAR